MKKTILKIAKTIVKKVRKKKPEIEIENKKIETINPKKVRIGDKFHHHTVTEIIEKNNVPVAVQCDCTARITKHPIIDGDIHWSKIATVI